MLKNNVSTSFVLFQKHFMFHVLLTNILHIAGYTAYQQQINHHKKKQHAFLSDAAICKSNVLRCHLCSYYHTV